MAAVTRVSTQANLGLVDPVVEALWFDPATTGRVLAGTWTGIFRSTDNGDHWAPAKTCTSISSSVGPVNAFLQVGGVLFAASGLGLLQSIDHGDTWCIEQPTQSPVRVLSASGGALYMGLRDGHVMVQANAGGAWLSTVPSPSGGGVRSVAANPVDPNICYAATVAYPQSLYVTKDGGYTWTAVKALSGGSIIQAIAFQPGDQQTVFVGRDLQLLRSNDSGGTWQIMAESWDIRAIYPDSAGISGRVVVASDQGLFLSTDNGVTWSSLNGNLSNSILYNVAVSGSTILVSMQDYPAIASYDGGRTWNYIAVIPEGGEIRFHPANPLYAYYFGNGFMYSTDGERTFQAANCSRHRHALSEHAGDCLRPGGRLDPLRRRHGRHL